MLARPVAARPLSRATAGAGLAAVVLAVAAGCGSPAATPSSPGGGPAAGSASTAPAASRCRHRPAPRPAPATLTLHNGSNGETFCVRPGQRVLVYLDGSAEHRWSAVRSDSAALTPAPSGELMLRLGVTGASFAAARTGVAHLSSARAACIKSPVRCDALLRFRVTVVVLAR
jgi:hypothetical protein